MSIGESFHCFSGSWIRILKRNSCSSSVIENQYLIKHDTRTDQHSLEFRHRAEELLEFFVGAETHHALDTGAIVPASVEEDHFATGRKMRDITLKIPLMAFPLCRSGQRDRPADARIEPLGHALDRASLSGRIPAFEKHNHLQLLMLNPILQPHQFVLQTEKFPEVDLSLERLLCRFRHSFGDQIVEPVFLHLHFQLFIEAVGDFGLYTAELVLRCLRHGLSFLFF